MKNVAFSLLLTAFLFGGCSKEGNPSEEQYVPSNTPIMFGGAQITSRAPFEVPVSPATTTLATHVAANLNQSTPFTGILAESNISFTVNDAGAAQGNAMGFTPAAYYPANPATSVYVIGYYPVTGWLTSGFTPGGGAPVVGKSAQFHYNGSHDVMCADMIATVKGDATGPAYKNLNFYHCLVLLDVLVQAESPAAISAWGNITKMELKHALGNPPNDIVAVLFGPSGTPNALTWGRATGQTTPLSTYLYSAGAYTDTPFTGVTVPLTETATRVAYVMTAPITFVAGNNANVYTFSVTTENGGAAKDVIVSINNTSGETGRLNGKRFSITLTFKAQEIQTTATVTEWTDGGIGSGEL